MILPRKYGDRQECLSYKNSLLTVSLLESLPVELLSIGEH